MQPMSVLFTVPEDSLSNILQRLRAGQKLAVDAYDRSLTNKIASGTLSNADNEIDTTTGTLKLRAMFDNSKFELFPSQFVNVRLLLDTLHNAIVVPGAAMQQGASGSYVYVVKADSTVSMRAVTPGPSSGDLVSISKGLQTRRTGGGGWRRSAARRRARDGCRERRVRRGAAPGAGQHAASSRRRRGPAATAAAARQRRWGRRRQPAAVAQAARAAATITSASRTPTIPAAAPRPAGRPGAPPP
jgi:multidrug efflux system membrane fusion protein